MEIRIFVLIKMVFMAKLDIRWQQRFSNYWKALAKLTQAVDLLSVQVERDESVDELLQEGLIQLSNTLTNWLGR